MCCILLDLHDLLAATKKLRKNKAMMDKILPVAMKGPQYQPELAIRISKNMALLIFGPIYCHLPSPTSIDPFQKSRFSEDFVVFPNSWQGRHVCSGDCEFQRKNQFGCLRLKIIEIVHSSLSSNQKISNDG
jgi:hypothetical protein